jgi:heme exporter protein C
VLILWFAYAAYFGLRASIEEYSTKARFSAVYSIFAFVTVPLSYLSSMIFISLHPTTSELKFDAVRGSTLGMMIVAFLFLYTAYMFMDTKLSEIKERMGGEFYG